MKNNWEDVEMKEFSNLSMKPSRQDRKRLYDFMGAVIFLTAALVGISLMMGQAKQSDFNGEKVLHVSCVVKDKEINPNRYGKNYNTYTIRTSCGDFVTDADFYDAIAQDKTYDITTTGGNWANKPTIVLMESSAE